MTNPKTYYCAWHPEHGYNLQTIDHIEGTCRSNAIYYIAGSSNINPLDLLKKKGWQIKEVVIVEKDEFDKLTKEQENGE